MTFGETLREARKKSGKRQRDIAKEVGRRQPTVHAWEADEATPRPNLIRAVARAYRVRPSVLMSLLLGRAS